MIYVDDMRARYGRMIMCHMIADSSRELLTFAWRLGIHPKWIQHRGTPAEHFDISLGKRTLAVNLGAKEITRRELVEIIRDRRRKHGAKENRSA